MGKYFGTDGVRGVANEDLTPEMAFRLGRSGGAVLSQETGGKPLVVIGRDTRISSPMLEAALVAGLTSIGADVIRLGVVTTPCVAFSAMDLGAAAGVMISASHNPMEDNGIKFFGGDGYKLSDAVEDAIEVCIDGDDRLPRPTGAGVGTVRDEYKVQERYLAKLASTIGSDKSETGALSGQRIVLDCANGAAIELAPALFRMLGADVRTIHDKPDGLNINADCGSTHPEVLQAAVIMHGADLGLAFDGDADRLIAVDGEGHLVNGDGILYICGRALHEAGRLPQAKLVTTVMSNLGLLKALREAGIEVLQTGVGDRYVMEGMRQEKLVLGGEQSGHVIFLEHSTTGDGLLTAVQLAALIEPGNPQKTLAALVAPMPTYPQVLINVKVKDKTDWDTHASIQAAIGKAEQALGRDGRLLVRPSGTEKLIRVMAEGPQQDLIDTYVQEVAAAIESELG